MHSAAVVGGAVREAKVFVCVQSSINMTTMIRVPYTLSVCAAAAVLAACGDSTQFPNTAAQTPVGNAITSKRVASPSFAMPERIGASSSGNEVLTGTATLHRCRPQGFGFFRRFHAHGKATGPYPGTFTANGTWGITCFQKLCYWGVNERFIITSGPSKVSGTITGNPTSGSAGTCKAFGPASQQYTSNHGDGNADIQIIKKGDFSETLDGL
jgi:hypothetical protein